MAIKTREAGDVVIFDLEGEMILPRVEKLGLHGRVKELLRDGNRHFLVNFSKVPFMDSSGFGEFFASFLSVQNAGGKIKLESVPPRIRLVFDITAVSRLFEFFEDEETALKSFL